MTQVDRLVVFGAGPALGLATARRFGRAGHAVTLVGRNAATVDPLVGTLRGEGITADRELVDLHDPAAARALAEQIGVPSAVVYAPGGVERLPVGVADLDAAALATWLPLNLYSPLEIAHVLVPRMVERGSGAFLVAQGVAVREVLPELASVGVAQSALLTYLRALAAEVGARGVRVASLQIGQLIQGSAAEPRRRRALRRDPARGDRAGGPGRSRRAVVGLDPAVGAGGAGRLRGADQGQTVVSRSSRATVCP